jgi:hypothetical protein
MKLRPRITRVLQVEEQIIRKQLSKSLPSEMVFEDNEYYYLINYRSENRKIWSPQMNITFEAVDGQTKVRASIGPQSSIWLVFVFFYFFFLLSFIGTLMYALSQWRLGHPSTLFFAISVISLTILIGMYLVSIIGQRKNRDQIATLSNWIKALLIE